MLRNFDSLSRITESAEQNNGVTDPTTVITYAYDSGINASPLVTPTFVLGHPAGATWPNGRVAFSYDPLGQTNGEVFTDQAGALYVQKPTHHANGLLNSLEFDLPDRGYNPETASYGYDSANRLRSINYLDSSGSVALYSADAIDALGRVQSAHYGPNVTYHGDYANTGRELITDAGVSSSLGSRLITFGPFDPLNRETSRQQFVNGAAAGTETDSAYDALGQLASVRVTDGGSTLFDWNISYDAQGNISQILDEGDKGAAVLLGICVRRP